MVKINTLKIKVFATVISIFAGAGYLTLLLFITSTSKLIGSYSLISFLLAIFFGTIFLAF